MSSNSNIILKIENEIKEFEEDIDKWKKDNEKIILLYKQLVRDWADKIFTPAIIDILNSTENIEFSFSFGVIIHRYITYMHITFYDKNNEKDIADLILDADATIPIFEIIYLEDGKSKVLKGELENCDESDILSKIKNSLLEFKNKN